MSDKSTEKIQNVFFHYIFIGRCSSVLLLIPDTIHNYTSMSLLIVALYIVSVILSILAQWRYSSVSLNQLIRPGRWCRWYFKILIYFVLSTICNHLANALSCRPIEILYDLRYISMLFMNIVDFFSSLLLAFFLGIKYASVDRRRWKEIFFCDYILICITLYDCPVFC